MASNGKIYLSIILTIIVILSSGRGCFAGQKTYPHRGFYELSLETEQTSLNPYFDVELQVVFERPDSSKVTVDAFYDGDGVFKARAYCDAVGLWRWESSSNVFDLSHKSGEFQVKPSSLPGKLRLNKKDRRQFAYDNGKWFLHIGDTGYRYVTQTEPKWKEYIDQASVMGATKIRTWFCQGRSDVQILFANERKELNLRYWQEIDRRLLYALEKYPHIIFKLILYGEDTEELRRYEAGDKASRLIARYAQARFSALPNIYWCISNDREIVPGGKLTGRKVLSQTIDKIGRDMAAREPWGTLITNHQSRFKGYDFVDADWSDVITLEDLDQVDGRIFKEYYGTRAEPMVLDEDRYEHWRNPRHDRYYFRRLMWAALLSGGHATYGGLRTYEPYDGNEAGVQGYRDAVRAGKLEHGADDFGQIHNFFRQTGLTLVGMRPDDATVGDEPDKYKCIHDDNTYIIYLANPDGPKPGEANVSKKTPNVTVRLPEGRQFAFRWYNPRRGIWTAWFMAPGGNQTLVAPGGNDWILLLKSKIPTSKGPLRIHPKNPRYFTDGSGRAVFLTGSHTWANFQERGVEGETPDFDYERYLDWMQERGHNFMRMWRWEHAQWMQFVPRDTLIRYKPMAYMRTGPGKALDDKPKFDLNRFNQTYFDRLRERVIAAGERGIYVSVMMFQGFSVEQKGTKGVDPKKGNAWEGHPYNVANNVNGVNGDLNGDGEGEETHTLKSPEIVKLQEAYIRKVIDTLNDLDNVLWEISNESHTNSIEWQYHLIRFIKKYEAAKPKQHPVGMTSSPINNPPLFASPADWISPYGREYINDPPDTEGRKVIIVDNDHISPWNADPQWIWKNFMRGNNFILMDSYMDYRIGSPKNPDPKLDPARKAMGFARWLSERADLASLTPRGELASTKYCLANPGHEYLVYQPHSGAKSFTVKLELGKYTAEWTDLTSGRVMKTRDLRAEVGLNIFTSPFDGPSILHLKRKR